MMKREGYQQGDILIVKVDGLPVTAKPAQCNSFTILAQGEYTGHAHRIEGIGWGTPYWADDVLFLDVIMPVTVRHEEHDIQIISPGIYEISRVREIDPFSEEIHTVKD